MHGVVSMGNAGYHQGGRVEIDIVVEVIIGRVIALKKLKKFRISGYKKKSENWIQEGFQDVYKAIWFFVFDQVDDIGRNPNI